MAATGVTGGADAGELSFNVAASSNGATELWLAPANGSVEYAVAAANAVAVGGRAIEAASSDEATVERVRALSSAVVHLVGHTEAFSRGLRYKLAGTTSVDATHVSIDPAAWSVGGQIASSKRTLVLVTSKDKKLLTLAALTSVSLGYPLIVTSQASANLDNILGHSKVLIPVDSGASGIVYGSLHEGSSVQVLPADQVGDQGQVMQSSVARGARIGRVVAARSESLTDTVAAALTARRIGGVAAGRAAAVAYLGTLQLDEVSTEVVGVGATTADAVEFRSKRDVPRGAPEFRVVDTRLISGSGFDVAVTKVQKAERYVAYDLDGKKVGASPSATVRVGGEPRNLAIVAQNSSGRSLAIIQYRVNSFVKDSERESVVLGSSSAVGVHFLFLGATGVPRLILRSKIATSSDGRQPVGSTVLGLTCASSFTAPPVPKSTEYSYTVRTLSLSQAACGGSRLTEGTALTESTIRFTTFAPVARALRTRAQVVSGRSLEAVAKKPSIAGARNLGAGDSWAPVRFRYQTFIVQKKLPGLVRASVIRPFVAFGGDGRNFYDPNGSYRTQQDVRMWFGSRHRVAQSFERAGLSHRYNCWTPWPVLSGCKLEKTARQSSSTLWISNVKSGLTSGAFTFRIHSANPLQKFAPAIDASVRISARQGATTVTGTHDLMPIHSLYFTVDGWNEWEFLYGSDTSFLPCLVGALSVKGWSCTRNVNASM